MSNRDEYEEILSENVKEAKKQIRDLEDPDYNLLYELETEGKNRKTLVEFLEDKAEVDLVTEEDQPDGQMTLDDEEDESGRVQVTTEKAPSANKFLVIGVLVGLALGLAGGFYLDGMQQGGNPQAATQQMNDLLSGSFNGTVDVGTPETRHGMYFFNVTLSQDTENGTQMVQQPYYMTKDAKLLFPVIQQNPFVPPIPIDIDEYNTARAAQ